MMKPIKVFSTIIPILVIVCFSSLVKAQNGDQILDGIGETGMVSRYIFNGDFKDWSRNNLHGIYQGGQPKFVSDPKFNTVLSFENNNSTFLSLPSDALLNIESLNLNSIINSI